MNRFKQEIRRWIRIAFGAAGLVFLLVALVSQWEDIRHGIELSVLRLAVGVSLVALSIIALAHGWAKLLPGGSDSPKMRKIFYTAQPAKYIPGGIAQPVGQVVLTTHEGVTSRHSISAFIVHTVVSVVAGAWLGSGVVLISGAPGWLKLCAAFGFVSPLVLWRPVLLKAATLIARLIRRPFSGDLLPTQRDTVFALGWALAGILATAIAFAVIAGSTVQALGWELVVAFSFAFTVGYLAVPFPSGIGIREGALSLVLPATGLAPLVAVSGIHRLVSMVAELFVLGASQRGWYRSTRSRARETPTHSDNDASCGDGPLDTEML